MNDERAVAAIMEEIPDLPLPDARYTQGFLKHLVARHILAALRAEGYAVVSTDFCLLHLEPRATSEDKRVCWGYDGGEDCRFMPRVPVGGDS